MNIKIEKITQPKFQELNVPIINQDDKTDRSYGLISSEGKKYKIGWQSTDIIPSLISLTQDRVYAIGVDLTFIIFNIDTGEIHLKLELEYFFYLAKIYNNFIYVATELEVIKIELENYRIRKTYDLPEYFEDFAFNEEIKVKCKDGHIINLD